MCNEYEKLNEYLMDICEYLKKRNPYLLNNICQIIKLGGIALNRLHDFYFESIAQENNLSVNDTEKLARKIIENISKDYLKMYDDLLDSKRLKFIDNKQFDDSYVETHIEDDGSVSKQVIINRKHNYSDIRILVHEFIHYTTCECFSLNHEILSEFFAIYFEFYAVDFLLKQGVSLDKIDFNYRMQSFRKHQVNISNYGILLFIYFENGKLDDEAYNLVKKYFPKVSFDKYVSICNRFCKMLSDMEADYQEIIDKNPDKRGYCLCHEFILIDYKYVLGTILAVYCYKYSKLEDIVKLNDSISSCDDLTMEEILKKIGIDLYDENFISNLKVAFLEYANRFKEIEND